MRGRGAIRVAFAAVAAFALTLLSSSAGASPTTAKPILYVSGGTLHTVAANGTAVTDLGVTGTNPSSSADGATILYDDGTDVRRVGSATALCATGTDPAVAPAGDRLAYVGGGVVTVATVAGPCTTVATFGSGSDPAWAPDGTQIAFVAGGDVAVAPAGGGAATVLPSGGDESDPAWSPDGTRLAYVSGGQVFVMNVDGTARMQLTTSGGSSPSWAPGADELVYVAGGALMAIPSGGGSPRELVAAGASTPDWGPAVANTVPPTITLDPTAGGVIRDGVLLSAGIGGWTSLGGVTGYAFQWRRCSSAGTGCVPISGATGDTYTVDALDVGARLRVTVTASTADGSTPGTSAPTDVVAASAPANVVPPAVGGDPILGETLEASTGTWFGANLVFTYRWKRCDAAGANCAHVGPASTSSLYAPASADVGKTLRVEVTATNAQGNATAESLPSPLVSSNVPANTALPTVTESSTAAGATSFTANRGTWTGAPTIAYAYQWRRCDAGGANCRDIAGAVSTTYSPASADVGSRLRVAVTASNDFGTTIALSEPSAVVAGQAPVNSVRPSVGGTERVGSVLSATNGTWTGTLPLTYTYQWQRCNATGAACASIAGATAQSYVAATADAGATLVVLVTARNAAGTATVASAPTDVVAAAAVGTPAATRPTSTRPPSFTGRAVRGLTLRASPGTWTGTTPMTISYQWQRCPRTGTACAAIRLATRSTYTLVAADVGRRIRLLVTAGNAAGSTRAASTSSAVVAARATLRGTARNDRLVGTALAETISGLAGNDRIDGKGGRDVLLGGAGNDTILAVDGAVDTVDCGPGRDRATVDRADRVRRCEVVVRRRPQTSGRVGTRG
ncbi:MAG TPA: hypothetical protein VK874_07075 [Gaiellaceae bacterium]|nr:hypothetical protein [Gaiellaceae bacterium]